jgi:hypothetical protein
MSKQTGAELIAAERQRQIVLEGFTEEHDDQHIQGELRDAAIAYAMVCDARAGENAQYVFPASWNPEWDQSWWKPKDTLRNLVRAGALIAAEIDRLQRTEAQR